MHWKPISPYNPTENSHLTPPLGVWESRTENTRFPVQFEFTQICDMLMFRLSRWWGRQSLVEDCFSLSAYYFQTNTFRGKCAPSSLCFSLSENRKEEEWSCLAVIVLLCLPACAHLIGLWENVLPFLWWESFAVFVFFRGKRTGCWMRQRKKRGEFENKSLEKGADAMPL